MPRLRYLTADLALAADDQAVLEAVASTSAAQHPAVLAEVDQLLAWCHQRHPDTQGPLDEGGDWQHDLQVTHEADGWHSVSLTLTARSALVDDLMQTFFNPCDDD